jgi:hypothetical protein
VLNHPARRKQIARRCYGDDCTGGIGLTFGSPPPIPWSVLAPRVYIRF